MKEYILYTKEGKRITLQAKVCYWYLNGERLYTWSQLLEETDYLENKVLPELKKRDVEEKNEELREL